MLAASIDDEQVSRPVSKSLQCLQADGPYAKVRSRALRTKIKRKDGHPPLRPQLRTPSQHRSRQVHHTVRYLFYHAIQASNVRLTYRLQQLPNLLLHLLPHHLRPLLPAQTSLHIPLRSRYRIHNDVFVTTIPFPHMPTLRLCRIRHLHPTHQEDLPGLSRHAEP